MEKKPVDHEKAEKAAKGWDDFAEIYQSRSY